MTTEARGKEHGLKWTIYLNSFLIDNYPRFANLDEYQWRVDCTPVPDSEFFDMKIRDDLLKHETPEKEAKEMADRFFAWMEGHNTKGKLPN